MKSSNNTPCPESEIRNHIKIVNVRFWPKVAYSNHFFPAN